MLWTPLGSDVLAHARALRRHHGVHGVFVVPQPTGKRLCLVGHCSAEPAGELRRAAKRGSFGCYALRVVISGVPQLHLVDHTDEVGAGDGPRPRGSTITGIRRAGASLWVVASGHATLPYGPNNRILSRFDASASRPPPVTINDGGGGFFRAELMAGAFAGGRSQDFALLRIRNASDDMYDGWHAATGASPPWTMRSEPLARGTQVWHVSRLPHRPQRILGAVTRVSASSVDVRAPDGTMRTYTDVIAVEASAVDEFSIGGESGSLVVDDTKRVVGTVIAGRGKTSYVLPASSLARSLEQNGLRGFLEE